MARYRGLTINQRRLLAKCATAHRDATDRCEPSGTTKAGSDQLFDHRAPLVETPAVISQKSAEAIVADLRGGREGQGPNMRDQGGALAHSTPATTPTGEALERRGATKPSLHDNLMERVLDRTNLLRAWKRVKGNKGAPGIDGLTLEAFPASARAHWSRIRQDLDDGSYRPEPVRRVMIPKPDGGQRMLGIPTVTDRLIQQAIAQVLTPIFDPGFSESSFGFREGRSAHGALKQVKAYVQEGYRIAVDLDLAKFFDTVNHDVLMARIGRKVRDKRLLALIGHYLRAGVSLEGIIHPSDIGTPQGGPFTPLTILHN